MSFTSDGKGKTDVDMIAGDYKTVMYKYQEVEEQPSSFFNDSMATRHAGSRSEAPATSSNKSSKVTVKSVTDAMQ